MDGVETGRTEPQRGGLARDLPDEVNHLAKVRIAGSNPVVRSIVQRTWTGYSEVRVFLR